MGNFQQAPELKAVGQKQRDSKKWGKAIRTHELETAIMCGLGDRDFAAMKVMLFLTGNAANEGFRVAEKTIMERCNISESAYKNARKKLVSMGWISHEAGKHITVNYDAVYGGKGDTNNTPIEETKKSKGITDNTPLGICENTPMGYRENTYNNITNNINKYDNGEIETPSAYSISRNNPEEKKPVEEKKLPDYLKVKKADLDAMGARYELVVGNLGYIIDTGVRIELI